MKKIYMLRIILFISIIIIIAININFESNQVSEIDNRELIEASDITEGDITDNIEKYLSDRIGFRTEMINTYTKAMDKLFYDMIHPNYQYGEDGYIFSKVEKEAKNEKFQEVFSEFIASLQRYCYDKDIDFLYVIEPSKESVYTEYLPSGYNYENKNTEYLLELLSENGVNYLDNKEELIKYKNSVQVFDKKYDARHWNETGSIIGISAILERLNELNDKVGLFDISNYSEEVYTNTTLPVSYFEIDEDTIHYNLNNDNSYNLDNAEDDMEISSKYRTFEHYINESNSDAPKILVFAGSYFNDKSKFLTESFSEYIRIHNYHNVINYEYYIEMFKPDIVLFESTEYTHSNSYFPVSGMSEVIQKRKEN